MVDYMLRGHIDNAHEHVLMAEGTPHLVLQWIFVAFSATALLLRFNKNYRPKRTLICFLQCFGFHRASVRLRSSALHAMVGSQQPRVHRAAEDIRTSYV